MSCWRIPGPGHAGPQRGHALTTCQEDFDDAVLFLWFGGDMAAQVIRNHLSGYRVETIIFGEQGQIQIGHFDQRPWKIVVEAYGPPRAERTDRAHVSQWQTWAGRAGVCGPLWSGV